MAFSNTKLFLIVFIAIIFNSLITIEESIQEKDGPDPINEPNEIYEPLNRNERDRPYNLKDCEETIEWYFGLFFCFAGCPKYDSGCRKRGGQAGCNLAGMCKCCFGRDYGWLY